MKNPDAAAHSAVFKDRPFLWAAMASFSAANAIRSGSAIIGSAAIPADDSFRPRNGTVIDAEEGQPFDTIEVNLTSSKPVCLSSADASQVG